ncbi:MAG: N-acetylmuramoyl-L-alanine amidase [Candidatus Sumerlaeaceae bacterium]
MISFRGAAAPLISFCLIHSLAPVPSFAAGIAQQPNICTRGCWGAVYAPIQTGSQPDRAILHHTAIQNDFNTNGIEDSKANVRAIQSLHMNSNGWSDIGYHFLVDKFGNTFEGRAGTMTNWVIGSHSYMANTRSVGFNIMGYFHPPYSQVPTAPMLSALEDVIAWYMPNGWSAHGNPGYATGEFGTSPPNICGHNEVSQTACPGENVVPLEPEIRNQVQLRIDTGSGGNAGPTLNRKRYGHTVGYNDDGRQQLYFIGTDGNLYSRWQNNLNSGPWTWEGHGNPGVTLRPGVATSTNEEGTQQIFVIGTNGNVYSKYQTMVNAGWSGWEAHGNPGVLLQAGIATSANADERQQFFAVGTDGNLYSKFQTTLNAGWSAWEAHGNGGSPLRGTLDAGWNQDGRQQVFATGTDGNLYSRYQGVLNAGPWYWEPHGNPGVSLADGVTANANADGRQEIFVTGTNGVMYSRWQGVANAGPWYWSDQGNGGAALLPRIAGGANQDGRQQVFEIGNNGSLYSKWQGAVNAGPWYWEGHGNPGVGLQVGTGCGINGDGRQELFAVGTDGNVYSKWQNAPNSGWSAWGTHGNPGVTLVGISAVPLPPDVIVDNSQAGFSVIGSWATGTSAADKYGADYRYRSASAVTEPATWAYTAAQTRSYQVYAWWSQGTNRSASAPYDISTAGGTVRVNKNQQTGGGSWQSLGIFNINAGANTVKLSCWTTTGYIVLADAIKVVAR